MKKFIFSLLTLTLLYANVQAKDIEYNRVNIYDSLGVNTITFIFTYDQSNCCYNNVRIVNNLNDYTKFLFKVYLNGEWCGSRKANVPPLGKGTVFFNNMFTDCDSESASIEVVVYDIN